MRPSSQHFRKAVVPLTRAKAAAAEDEAPRAQIGPGPGKETELAVASKSVPEPSRGRWPRNRVSPSPARAARHFLFNGHGWSDIVLTFIEPEVGWREDEKATVA